MQYLIKKFQVTTIATLLNFMRSKKCPMGVAPCSINYNW